MNSHPIVKLASTCVMLLIPGTVPLVAGDTEKKTTVVLTSPTAEQAIHQLLGAGATVSPRPSAYIYRPLPTRTSRTEPIYVQPNYSQHRSIISQYRKKRVRYPSPYQGQGIFGKK